MTHQSSTLASSRGKYTATVTATADDGALRGSGSVARARRPRGVRKSPPLEIDNADAPVALTTTAHVTAHTTEHTRRTTHARRRTGARELHTTPTATPLMTQPRPMRRASGALGFGFDAGQMGDQRAARRGAERGCATRRADVDGQRWAATMSGGTHSASCTWPTTRCIRHGGWLVTLNHTGQKVLGESSPQSLPNGLPNGLSMNFQRTGCPPRR
ncbi:hypothetical protein BJ912DRAFT_1147068 [Pholiota molesta]|nr:hypothetical protein BJ912DRAFT_1147068 [Pholiota molesta]